MRAKPNDWTFYFKKKTTLSKSNTGENEYFFLFARTIKYLRVHYIIMRVEICYVYRRFPNA
jgi:hypothetical protein